MDKIKFEAEIDFSQPQGIVKIKAIEDPWTDFGYLLEIMSFMSKVVMDHEEKSKEEILQYGSVAECALKTKFQDFETKAQNNF